MVIDDQERVQNAAATRRMGGDYTSAQRLTEHGWTLISPYDGKTWEPGSRPTRPGKEEWKTYLQKLRRSRLDRKRPSITGT